MSMIKRVQLLEKHFGAAADPGPEAVLIFPEDASLKETEPVPITIFSCQGVQVHRADGETYAGFETRAIREASKFLPKRQSGQPAPTPCLIANGSLQE